ncbi:MAG TPA: dihydrolipoyl dehydrogenase [Gemmatimonadaceae bacterium]|jgi:dihydrolipoamide dehydrogenase|nr:dihydrolipoyl dehydrogenase [Gemmatimonadaceae bacterium]
MATELTPADVVIIGGGPGGYVAAIRAAQLGLSTVCVEMDKTLGGTCVNVGCIPSKALLTSSEHYEFARQHAAEHGIKIDPAALSLDLVTMLRRKDEVVGQNTRGIEFLFKKNKITWAKGKGSLRRTEKGLEVTVAPTAAAGGPPPRDSIAAYAAKNVIIATGSVPIELPFLKFDEERILSNIGALTILRVPRHLIVIGGGVIGLELGSVWRRLGAKVTVVELMPTILPGMDEDVVKECDRVFKRQGLDLRTGTRVVGGRRDGDRVLVDLEKDGSKETLEGDYALVAIGRKASLGGLDAVALGLNLGKRGEILVDDQMRTGVPNVYAIGDCVPGPMLAHAAEDEGVVAAEVIAGQNVHMHYKSIPNVVYTWPEIAAVGLTEREVKESGREYRVGKFPFSANGRARTMGENAGFVKLIADARTDELIGAHLVGPNVSELVAEVVLGFEYRASADDIGITVHAHPTLSESTKEAALAALGRALHI